MAKLYNINEYPEKTKKNTKNKKIKQKLLIASLILNAFFILTTIYVRYIQ